MTINRKTSLTGYQLRTGLKAAKGNYYYKKAANEYDARRLNLGECNNLCSPDSAYMVVYDDYYPEKNQCVCVR